VSLKQFYSFCCALGNCFPEFEYIRLAFTISDSLTEFQRLTDAFTISDSVSEFHRLADAFSISDGVFIGFLHGLSREYK
jgi:hypothetical protein